MSGLDQEGIVTILLRRAGRGAAATLALLALGACSGTGGLGNVLGSVLGGGGAQQSQGEVVSGAVQGVDARARQIGLQLSNGQSVVLSYDEQTQVVYQNQNYPVTALERGDRVTVRVQSNGNAYYTDLVQVDQSVSSGAVGSGGGGGVASGNVQALQGTVRQVDQGNGLFSLDTRNGVRILVTLPAGVSRNDVSRFQSLRPGDAVRLYGVFVTNTRVELRQFY